MIQGASSGNMQLNFKSYAPKKTRHTLLKERADLVQRKLDIESLLSINTAAFDDGTIMSSSAYHSKRKALVRAQAEINKQIADINYQLKSHNPQDNTSISDEELFSVLTDFREMVHKFNEVKKEFNIVAEKLQALIDRNTKEV